MLGVDAQEAWCEAGRRLLEADPQNFVRVLALARAYAALYDEKLESPEVFQARLQFILSGQFKASA